MARTQARIEVARALFAGWSSGDADAPAPYFHPDGTLFDVASGTFVGWPAIRDFFARGLAKWDDLVLAPDEFWANDDGLALHYVMSATVKDPTIYGAEHVGKVWRVEVMSFLRFDDDDRVVYEADFHDKGSRARSLGLA
jgi:ketosteroid isomerase-like protein